MVMITVSIPFFWSKTAACFAEDSSVTFTPVSISASFWLGVMIDIFFNNSSLNVLAGAGLSIKVIPIDAASVATYSTVSMGVSSCVIINRAFLNFSFATLISSGPSAPLAPEATTMQFSPWSSTVIRATPEGSILSLTMHDVSIPSFSNSSIDCLPKTSKPVFAMNTTRAPSLAAATAWLAPLPPELMKKVPPNMVSPGCGKWDALMTMSVLVLPTTTIEAGFIWQLHLLLTLESFPLF